MESMARAYRSSSERVRRKTLFNAEFAERAQSSQRFLGEKADSRTQKSRRFRKSRKRTSILEWSSLRPWLFLFLRLLRTVIRSRLWFSLRTLRSLCELCVKDFRFYMAE